MLFFTAVFYQVEEISLFSYLDNFFNPERVLDFFKCFLRSTEIIMWFFFFLLYSIDMVYYINLFSDEKLTLHSWDKSHLVIVCISCYMLLDGFASILEGLYVYSYEI